MCVYVYILYCGYIGSRSTYPVQTMVSVMGTSFMMWVSSIPDHIPLVTGVGFRYIPKVSIPRKPVAHNYNLLPANFPLCWVKVDHDSG